MFAWLISHQPAVPFSHNKPATSNQPAVLFSQNKPAPAISHQPTEQAAYKNEALSKGSFDIKYGTNVMFWDDTWIRDKPLKTQYPNLYNIARDPHATVSKIMVTRPLNISFRRALVDYNLKLSPTRCCKSERQNDVCIVSTVHTREGKRCRLQQAKGKRRGVAALPCAAATSCPVGDLCSLPCAGGLSPRDRSSPELLPSLPKLLLPSLSTSIPPPTSPVDSELMRRREDRSPGLTKKKSLRPWGKKLLLSPGKKPHARRGRSLAPAHHLGPSSSAPPLLPLRRRPGASAPPLLSLRRQSRELLRALMVAPHRDLLLLDAGPAPVVCIRGERDCKCASPLSSIANMSCALPRRLEVMPS
jgi:hypothetical protein